jgi:hypothetical protein
MTIGQYLQKPSRIEAELKRQRMRMADVIPDTPQELTQPDQSQAVTAIHRAARAVNTLIWHANQQKKGKL